jgi:alpha-mannosidase
VIVAHPHNVLENETMRIQIAANGTLNLQDKATGQVYCDLGYFEDGGDCGDGYNYSYPLEDRVDNTLGSSPRISRLADGPVVQRSRIDYALSLSEGLDSDGRSRSETRTICPLNVTVSLVKGTPRMDLQVTFDNHARDHRLRMIFPSDVNAKVSHASAQFDVVSHPVKVVPVPDDAWVEDAPTTFPQQDWVDLSDGERGLCIIVQGLPEYEILDTDRREVAVTLLRAVGFLGAGYDMRTASVGAGPHIATPEAQIQRKLTFSLSVLPHTGMWSQAEVWRQALVFNNPPRAYTTGLEKRQPAFTMGTQPATRSFLGVTGRNVVLSSVKKAEDGNALVLRLYNASEDTTEAAIHLPFVPASIHQVGMDENPRDVVGTGTGPVHINDERVTVEIPPKKVVTLRVERK